MATMDDFQKLDICVGKVIDIQPFPEGKYSTHVLQIDFGAEIGMKKSLAKLAPNYSGPELIGKLVMGVVNFPPRQIGPHQSEVLTLGVQDAYGNAVVPLKTPFVHVRLCLLPEHRLADEPMRVL